MRAKIVLLILILTVFQVQAQNITGNIGVSDKYLFPGSGLVLHDQEVVQGSLNYEATSGLYGNLWGSLSPDGEENRGDKTDYKIGWVTRNPGYATDIFVAYLDFHDQRKVGDVWLVSGNITRPIWDCGSAGFRIRSFQPAAKSTLESGWLVGPSLNLKTRPVNGFVVFGGAEVNYSIGFKNQNDGLVLNPSAGINYMVNPKTSIGLTGTAYFQMENAQRPDDEQAVTLGVSIKL